MDLCSATNDENKKKKKTTSADHWRSVLILVPARLGGEHFNTVYSPIIRDLLQLPYCLGIIGGKPRHSLYFVGFQDDKLIYLDPHYCQKSIDINDPDFLLDSFHCHTPLKVSLHSIDPSCSIGFYLKTRHEFDDFVEGVEQLRADSSNYPIFVLAKGRNIQSEATACERSEKLLRMQYHLVDMKGNVQKVINTEEFVLL